MHNELTLISAFIKRSKRDRYREFVSDPRLRRKFTSQLAHFSDFDPKYRVDIPSSKLSVDKIAVELRKRHSPNIVAAISEDPNLDQKWEMVRVLERNGIYIQKIKTDKPGYVVYEDEWQLVAEPFRKGTMTRR
ncbi:hypothetical protein Acid345_0538 [Candidatus Koribacter versatilis Ellin345]|uniref:Uncharacterized protein n=1 Tax=Koribacter versatilis (strain Ellin345) TaxID=204669 RepID=Q1IUA7_KORVE|nr:hypothetical protein [Candidatus Koribacter versatilis]ABF39543.1 hypothetical protein Acid345_0538 [Candidatus Koribacter versatilis Ellin345]